MKEQRTIYYSDELNEEFSSAKITPRLIDENYKYIRNPIWEMISLFLQNVLSMPIKFLYAKIKFKIKYVGKEKLKQYKNIGYFIYVNHTQEFVDTFIPSLANYPKRNFFIVNPENVSIKFLKTIVELLGAIPIPANKKAMKNFLEAIEKRIKSGYSITIYPEAHIWPYYTKIRPFKDVSFKYPIEQDVPSFCMTNTYIKQGKNGVRIVNHIDGPFFANKELPNKKEQQMDLRNRIYEQMVQRSKNSTFEYIKYVKKEVKSI